MDPVKAKRIQIVWGIVLFAASLLLFLSLVSFTPSDLSFYSSQPNPLAKNWVGIVGSWVSGMLLFSLGWSSFLIPAVLFVWGLLECLHQDEKLLIRLWGGVVLFVVLSALLSLSPAVPALRFKLGGIVGLFVCDLLIRYFTRVGSLILLLTFGTLSFILTVNLSVFPLLARALRSVKKGVAQLKPSRQRMAQRPSPRNERPEEPEKEKGPTPKIRVEMPAQPKPVRPMMSTPGKSGDYTLPTLDLLETPPPLKERQIRENLEESSRILEETLRDFGIEVKVTDVEQGPVITRYELQPAPGIKVNRITALSDDIALTMKAQSVRILAPIPGKAAVGIEVPNSTSVTVYLREVLAAPPFQRATGKLTLALGKDTAGEALVADLSEMPHLLIAGTTGSGKTVCVNAMIASLLFVHSPDTLKFLMVDPKMVELAMYNALPHLIAPVVTDPKKVKGALAWMVAEMGKRYQLLSKAAVRNIEMYNQKSTEGKLPYLILVIDELADLMMTVPQEVETAITRLAQLSRAVGIHMILATQRPSVDVLTGVIKANFPARISFKVASRVDSRTVLDMNGADKLIGRGDMLFLKPGLAKPIRGQSSYIQDKEIERVTEFIKSQQPAAYQEGLLQEQEKHMSGVSSERDEMYEQAARMVIETKRASVTMLQRRFNLGYSRAARLMDMMEEEGIVGPFRGAKPRDILIDSFDKLKPSAPPPAEQRPEGES